MIKIYITIQTGSRKFNGLIFYQKIPKMGVGKEFNRIRGGEGFSDGSKKKES
jgi:hypothetical protein